MFTNNNSKGKVIFIGAGPGDPELITLKAVRYLKNADVILTDRLVSRNIITEYAAKSAEVIYVGKQCRNGYSTPQENINELMVDLAQQGKNIVRLKGGDVSIFSNILDELKTLVKYKIEYEIVPGITAALGAAAYSGIPLTARNYSTAVRFLTYYNSGVVSDNYWKELAKTSDTLVFYMSSETLNQVIGNLTRNHINKDISVAVIEQATTPLQKVHTINIYDFELKWKGRRFASPSLIIIGNVVSLYEQFAWLSNAVDNKDYFKSTEDKYSEKRKLTA